MTFIYCSHCGKQISDQATTCPHCNAVLQPQPQPQLQQSPNANQQTNYVNLPARKSNGVDYVGFAFSTIGFVIGIVLIIVSSIMKERNIFPGCLVGGAFWLFGFLFSLIGIFKSPRGFAIAGLIISIVNLIALTLLICSVFAPYNYY